MNYHLTHVKKKKRKNNIYGKILLWFFGIFFSIGLSTVLFIVFSANKFIKQYTSDIPDINVLSRWSPPETTKIFSKNHNLLYQPHGDEVRTKISIAKLPEHLKNAFIAVEDKRFWQHNGIDFVRINASLIHDIQNPDDLQGASTITQQLIKNCLLNNGKSVKRKIQEMILSYFLEQQLPKEKILELYLNQIPFGSNIYGVEAASQKFWSKSASDLDLAESAILAAIPKAATLLSPYENPDALFDRQKIVLNLMEQQRLASPSEITEAKDKKIIFSNPNQSIVYPHFTMYALEELKKDFGEDLINTAGLEIVTSIDEKYQQFAEDAIQKNLGRIKKYGASNACIVVLNARTGQILAMVGSLDFWGKDSGQFNATLAYRQPGSTFKPLVYSAAFEAGALTPESIILDSYINFNGYKPHNFDYQFHGNITVRYALANSYNIPTVKTLDQIGLSYFTEKMSQMEIIIKKETGLSAALGAEATPPLKMASAYAALANNGLFNLPTPFIEIKNKNGNIINEYTPKNIRIFSEETTAMINSILSDYNARTATFGSLKKYLELSDRPVAAKTGTTDKKRDAWTIGYTPSIVCAVWVGNNDNTPLGKGAEGATTAAPIWKSFMEKAVKDTPVENFISWKN